MIGLILGNFKIIKNVLIVLAISALIWLVSERITKIGMPDSSRTKIDSLNTEISKIYQNQKKIDSSIVNFNKQVSNIDNNISNIKNQKETIKEVYYGKINRVNEYNDAQIDSFFTNRYGYTTR
jgi:glutaredoxin 2